MLTNREWFTCTSRCFNHTVTCPVLTVTWTVDGFWKFLDFRCMHLEMTNKKNRFTLRLYLCDVNVKIKVVGLHAKALTTNSVIEVYKIWCMDYLQFSWTLFCTIVTRSDQRSSLKLKKNRFRTELTQHFFSERVINIWNKLDRDTVCASSLNSFKQHLQKLYQDGSFHRLLQSVWPKRLSQFPLGRPHLVSYLVSNNRILRIVKFLL